MAGIATKKRIQRQKRERRIKKIARLADTLDRGDGLEELLAGTDDG